MVRRGFFIAALGLFGLSAAGVAGWQALENLKTVDYLAGVQSELQAAKARLGELDADSADASQSGIDELKADLGAARQRLSVAETAMKETEDRLAEEVTRRVKLEREKALLGKELDAAQQAAEAAEAKAEKAVSELGKIEAVLPASRLAPRDLATRAEDASSDDGNGDSKATDIPETTASITPPDDDAAKNEALDETAAPADAAAKAVQQKPKRRTRRAAQATRKSTNRRRDFVLESLSR